MSYTITDNTLRIQTEKTVKANIFLRLLAEDIVKNAEPKTPKKTGRMRADILKQVLGLKGRVVWGKNYAVYQEKKQFKNYTTPGTGPHFAENAVRESAKRTPIIAKSAGLT